MKTIHENITEDTKTGNAPFHDRFDLLRSRVDLLRGKDRVLMKMYLEQGNNFRQMALLAGVNEATIARKIYKLTKRLINSEYIMCLRSRSTFTGLELLIARDYFLSGLSMKKIAMKRRCSYYSVRKTVKKIRRMLQVKRCNRKSD